MSRIRADKLVNRLGTGGPKFPHGVAEGFSVTGIVTATSFKKSDGTEVGGVIAGINTAGVSTFTDLQVSGNATIGGNATITGNLTVNGTQTILNTTSLEVEDINVGIASASSKLNNTQLDGAGITIYGSQGDKSLTWDNSNSRMAFSTDVYAPRFYGDGSQLTGISAGGGGGGSIGTSYSSPSGITTFLDLSNAQDHKLTVTGTVTVSARGGTEGESHTVRIINSGISTVGFSTYFLFPSGSAPSLPTADGTISLISFTVNRVGAGGTQLLAGASVNYS